MTDIVDELRNGQKPMQILGGQYMSITAGPSIFERAAAEIERLRALLNGRDDFIVDRGLWSDFVAALPGSNEQSIKEKSE